MHEPTDDQVRLVAATADDEPFLWEMLAAAVSADPAWTVEQARATPDIAHYLTAWPRRGDLGLVAVVDGRDSVGATWLRYFHAEDPGYGFVDADTPELTIACRSLWRGRGIGRRLIEAIVDRAGEDGVRQISLSVDPSNEVAASLYRSLGFVAEGREPGGSVTMLCRLR